MAEIDHDAISYTALKVLEHRARDCTIPLAREMARAAGVQWRSPWAKRFLRKLVGGKVHSGLYLQLRYDALSRALAMYRGCAVLELAAGYGTRGIAESAQREAYIETDLGNLVARKERVGRSLAHHRFLRARHRQEPGAEADVAQAAPARGPAAQLLRGQRRRRALPACRRPAGR